jgi:hypothetical protein
MEEVSSGHKSDPNHSIARLSGELEGWTCPPGCPWNDTQAATKIYERLAAIEASMTAFHKQMIGNGQPGIVQQNANEIRSLCNRLTALEAFGNKFEGQDIVRDFFAKAVVKLMMALVSGTCLALIAAAIGYIVKNKVP